MSAPDMSLREVVSDDLPIIFAHQIDPSVNHMVAFTNTDPADQEAFTRHWQKLLGDPSITKRTIMYGAMVIGYLVSYELFGERNVGYWLGKEYWGQGLASRALNLFLSEETTRPLYARVAHDNGASLRVLLKCGFVVVGEDSEFSFARQQEVREIVLQLGSR